jgi:glutamate carboxypeptidase
MGWIDDHAARIAAHAERELAALVAVSSPSVDGEAAEEAIAVTTALLPAEADVERIPCSTPECVDDLLATVRGTGTARLLLVGHLDTVIGHGDHMPLKIDGDVWSGSGTVDMKGGDVIAIGVMRALVERSELFAEVALLLVVDEEWRSAPFAHTARFAGFDACLCFEAGELDEHGREAVVVKRKAAAAIEVKGTGLSAHSGVDPDAGRNALLALADIASSVTRAHHAPGGPERLTVVPTLMQAGEGLNVVPATASLTFDLRADDERSFDPVLAAIPSELHGVQVEASFGRLWPGMDSGERVAELLVAASALAGQELVPASRGGARDASHFASSIALTIDGLGPRGGGSHAPDEHVLGSSFEPRAKVALALAEAVCKRSM